MPCPLSVVQFSILQWSGKCFRQSRSTVEDGRVGNDRTWCMDLNTSVLATEFVDFLIDKVWQVKLKIEVGSAATPISHQISHVIGNLRIVAFLTGDGKWHRSLNSVPINQDFCCNSAYIYTEVMQCGVCNYYHQPRRQSLHDKSISICVEGRISYSIAKRNPISTWRLQEFLTDLQPHYCVKDFGVIVLGVVQVSHSCF